jgi:hypothetical protein
MMDVFYLGQHLSNIDFRKLQEGDTFEIDGFRIDFYEIERGGTRKYYVNPPYGKQWTYNGGLEHGDILYGAKEVRDACNLSDVIDCTPDNCKEFGYCLTSKRAPVFPRHRGGPTLGQFDAKGDAIEAGS